MLIDQLLLAINANQDVIPVTDRTAHSCEISKHPASPKSRSYYGAAHPLRREERRPLLPSVKEVCYDGQFHT